MIAPKLRYDIIQALRKNLTAEQVAEELNASLTDVITVQRQITAANNQPEPVLIPALPPAVNPTDEPTHVPVPRTYDQPRRIALLDKALDKAEEILADTETPRELLWWAQGTQALVSMRRLEDGEATHKYEIDDLRNNLAQRIDDINSRGPYALKVVS